MPNFSFFSKNNLKRYFVGDKNKKKATQTGSLLHLY